MSAPLAPDSADLLTGPLRFGRCAFPPNRWGYCGPSDHQALLEHVAAHQSDRGLVELERHFAGAYPYLMLIARANHITDPLDRRVVEAYWLGNTYLEQVDATLFYSSLDERFRRRMSQGEFGWLTTWGLEAFRKDAYKTNMRVSKDFEDYAPAMMEAMQAKHVPSWMENFLNAREVGDVKVYACSMTMELFGIKLEDMEPIVDDVTGVATFVERAKDGKVTLFI